MVETKFDVYGPSYGSPEILDGLESLKTQNPVAEFIDNTTYMKPVEAVVIMTGDALVGAAHGLVNRIKNLRKPHSNA